MTSSPTLHRGARIRDALVVALAVTSGATDALGFLALGSAFTSVMTGNMVLFGVAAAEGHAGDMIRTAVAIGSFVAGAALGTRIAGTPTAGDPVWPAAVTKALAVEVALFAGVGAAWWVFDSRPGEAAVLPMLAAAAVALGLQSSAIQRFGVPGLSTTYLTGTLTSVVIRLVSGHGFSKVRHSAAVLAGLVVGAALMAAVLRWLPSFVPVVIVGTPAAVLVVVTYARAVLHR